MVNGTPFDDTLIGGTGNEILNGHGGSDTFIGGSGIEILNGSGPSTDSDLFIIGQGSTTAYGGSGQNTYSYAPGDGALTISTSGGTNTLLLGSGLVSSQITYTASGNDLLITDGSNGDYIRLLNELGPSRSFTNASIRWRWHNELGGGTVIDRRLWDHLC